MNPTLKKTAMHGLEVAAAAIAAFAISFYLQEVAPTLPQEGVWGVATVLLGSVLKWLRANPNITKFKDYVND